ncbi:MAG TPA: glycosyl hydrolase 115 family protein [Verrucomicrobiae bacterium]
MRNRFLPIGGLPRSVWMFAAILLLPGSLRADDFLIVANEKQATVIVDPADYPVVQLAANFFAEDVARVTGHPLVVTNTPAGASLIIAGTLGRSATVDALAAAGKIPGVDQIKGRWETTLWQIVEKPLPGVDHALVIVGSDRRGTAYGLMRLSEQIGVSPWYWWADVSVRHRETVAVNVSAGQMDAPGVKYRGIFLNDEDWGLNPWAAKTFDPDFKNIGPKTYARIFELMLRLRLNYIWPAMHACSAEFSSVPENALLADKFGIVAGSSHCEPMLCNNVHWNEKERGRWNYSVNRDTIHSYWEDNVKARSTEEAVWTLGIRGIHDAGMEKPPTALPDRINLVSQVIKDQRELLAKHVSPQWGPVAQCFVPYKEVLPIYDAGLKVPDDVTLVWVDDNFGYIRRLSAPAERQRPGGAGVYWHLSYYGGPHSYTWINTTAPALLWEELHKAWENDARSLWVINVGDIKPMEIGIDYFSRFAWNPDGFALGGQRAFLHGFAVRNFGGAQAQALTDLLMDYYRLGTVRKPELMDREWALSLSAGAATELEAQYKSLLAREQQLAAAIPAEATDAYTEMVGFSARVEGMSGLIFMADRKVQLGIDLAATNEIMRLRRDLEGEVERFNTKIAGGKWNHMMPGLVTGKDLMRWSSQVRWPWGESSSNNVSKHVEPRSDSANEPVWRDAATLDRQKADGPARWNIVEGLGPSGRALALLPASLSSSWNETDTNAPTVAYDFTSQAGETTVLMDFVPTFRIYPGTKLRVAVSVDDQPATLVEVPGSNGEDENGAIRSLAVQDNYARARVVLPGLVAGKHTLKVRAVDPGAVIDRISL